VQPVPEIQGFPTVQTSGGGGQIVATATEHVRVEVIHEEVEHLSSIHTGVHAVGGDTGTGGGVLQTHGFPTGAVKLHEVEKSPPHNEEEGQTRFVISQAPVPGLHTFAV